MILPPQTCAKLAALKRDPAAAAAWAPVLITSVRVDTRNAMINALLATFYGNHSTTKACKALADEMGAPLAGTVKGDLISAIMALNHGRRLSWRQLCNIVGAQNDARI